MDKQIYGFREDLRHLAATDRDVAQFLEELESTLRDEPIDEEDLAKFSGVETMALNGLLLLFIAYVLFRLAKDSFDYLRALNETDIAERQAEIVKDLMRDGVPPEVSTDIVAHLLTGIAKRTHDDPVLQRVGDYAKKRLMSGDDNPVD